MLAAIVIVYVVITAVMIVYWQRTEKDREEVITFGVDRFKEAGEDLEEKIDRITTKIFNGIRDFFASTRGIIDANSAQITQFIREKVSAIFKEQIVNPAETTPTIPPTTSPNSTVPAPSVPQTPSQVRSQIPSQVLSPPSATVPSTSTALSDINSKVAQIQAGITQIEQEQAKLFQNFNSGMDRLEAGIDRIEEENAQRLQNFHAKMDSLERDISQLEEQKERERLASEMARLRGQQREWELEIAKAAIADNSHNELWRQRLADIPENQREAVIRKAATKYSEIIPNETIDINNPNPHNVPLWSDIIAQVISDREPGNEQFGFARQSALTPRSGATSQETLGGFNAGERLEVDDNTAHKPQEKLPELEGFGAGERLEVDEHTGHTPQEPLPPLPGFDLDPQLDVYDLSISRSRRNQPGNQPTGAEIRQQITKIASRYKIFKCVECAAAIKKFLIKQGIHGTHIKVDTGSSDGYAGIIYHLVIQEQIALNGHHEGIAIVIDGQELVFDNISHEGVLKEVWLQNLYSPIMDMGEKFQITETDF